MYIIEFIDLIRSLNSRNKLIIIELNYLICDSPVDFLGIDHDRLTIMFVFGAATGSILVVTIGIRDVSNPWAKGKEDWTSCR